MISIIIILKKSDNSKWMNYRTLSFNLVNFMFHAFRNFTNLST